MSESIVGQLYVLQFLDDWVDFRYAEFLALLKLEGFQPELLTAYVIHDPNGLVDPSAYVPIDLRNPSASPHTVASILSYLRRNKIVQHFLIFSFSDEAALVRIANRAVLVKNIYRLWGHEASFPALVDAVRHNSAELMESYLQPENSHLSWSVEVVGFGRSFTMPEKQALRTHFSFLQFPGPVSLRSPDIEMCLLCDYSAGSSYTKSKEDNVAPSVPCYLGRRLPTVGMRDVLKKYSLKTRPYLGPTSLDDALTFILANMVGCKSGMVSYEPFVGTGSIVVALAHLGVFCVGSDIDPRVLRGEMYAGQEDTVIQAKKKRQQQYKELKQNVHALIKEGSNMPVDICTNFRIYDLPTPELVRMDAHLFGRHFRPMDNFFDVIVTDPPYGIRAGARKSGRRDCDYQIPTERRHDHIPSTQTYPVEEVMLDLLDNAARSLVLGGPLVYLIPTTYDFTEQDLPRHPCLALEEVCHQELSSRHGRRAVVMRKTQAWSEENHEKYVEYKQRVLSGEVRLMYRVVVSAGTDRGRCCMTDRTRASVG